MLKVFKILKWLKNLNSFSGKKIVAVFHLRNALGHLKLIIPLTYFSGPFKTIPVVAVGVGVGKQELIRLS